MPKRINLLIIFLLFLSGCETNIVRQLWGPDEDNISSLIYEGEKALAEKGYSRAYDYFDRALELDPTRSRARYGRAKARFALKIEFTSLALIGEKIVGIDEQEPDGDPPQNEPLLNPQDFNFDSTYDRRLDFYHFAQENFIDIHQIIWGLSDGEIPSDDVSANLDCAIFGLMSGILVVWKDYPQFNAFWDDSLKDYILNLSVEVIAPTSPLLGDAEEYLQWAYYASNRAYNFSDAHTKSYLRKLRGILWSILNSVRFYRAL